MNREQLAARIYPAGFRNPEAVESLIRDAVRLRVSETEGTPLGSRLGGRPAMPKGAPWPTHEERSLSFIAQLDLGNLPKIVDAGWPVEGLLLFFYDAMESPWGFDPNNKGSFKVIFAEPSAAIAVQEWPGDLPEDVQFLPRRLDAEVIAALPPWDSVLVEDLALDPDELRRYQDLLDSITDPAEWATLGLLGGYPDAIQGDMALECALVSAGLNCGDGKAYQDPRILAFRSDARDWRLLLQVPSVDSAGMMWDDCGCLYYWIRDDDLRQGRFDNAWMILQCY